MSTIIALILVALGAFLFWFGYEVGSGKHKPNPYDKFFPLLGRNIDYVLGTSGTLMSIGVFILAFGVWGDIKITNYFGAFFIAAGIVRAYLPPDKFGPGWYRRKKSNKRPLKKTKKPKR